MIQHIETSFRELKYTIGLNAFRILREYLRIKKGGKYPPDAESIIIREIEPVRPGRKLPLQNKSQVYSLFHIPIQLILL